MKEDQKRRAVIQFKGYIITFKGKYWTARAYANPEFSETNLSRLKKLINEYLTT